MAIILVCIYNVSYHNHHLSNIHNVHVHVRVPHKLCLCSNHNSGHCTEIMGTARALIPGFYNCVHVREENTSLQCKIKHARKWER